MDDISQAFSSLTPEDLIRDSSMTHEETLVSDNANVGRDNFQIWVSNALSALRVTALTLPELGFSILQNPNTRRHFSVEADETGPMYAARLRREAQAMQATWFFNVLTAPGAAYDVDENPKPVDHEDIRAIHAALESGRLSMSLCWYAEMQEPDETCHRAGIIPVAADGTTGEGREGRIVPEENLFGEVLPRAE